MRNITRILVADDLARDERTAPSAALKLASDLAASLSAEIHLVHSYHIPELTLPVQSMVALEAPYVEEMRKALNGESDNIRSSRPALRIVPEVEKGDTVEVLLKEISDHGCDLAVLHTHARKGVRRALLGSVTEQFIRRSPVPVLTVNPHTRLENAYRPTKILVALDLTTPQSSVVAEAAADFGRLANSQLILSHVIEEWAYPVVQSASLLAGGAYLPLERDLREEAIARDQEIKKLAQQLALGLPSDVVQTRIIEKATSIGEAIVDLAVKEDCNLIVMSHHRMGRLEAALLGSVNRQVIRDAHCPVLTLPE